jgi:DNA polymerase-3 subunit delta'
MLKIRPFNKEEIVGYLTEKLDLSSSKALNIANITSGDLNWALKLVNEVEDGTNQLFQEWMRICFTSNYIEMVEKADVFFKTDKINQKGLFQYGLTILRESLIVLNGSNGSSSLVDAENKFVLNFSKTLDLTKLEKLYAHMNAAIYHLERNGNAKITFLDTSLQISATFRS